MTVKKEILTTFDYDKFSVLAANRGINQFHVDKIAESMLKKQLVCPILVNEKYEIIDGQHRYFACMKSKLPIYYVMADGYGYKEVMTLNIRQKNWSILDFFKHYLELKYPEYIKLDNLAAEFNIGALAILRFTGIKGGENGGYLFSSMSIKEGNLKVTNEKRLVGLLNLYSEIKDYWDFSHVSAFQIALRRVEGNKNFNLKQFKEQCHKHHEILKKRHDEKLACMEFQKLYNFGKHKRERIYSGDL
jgi:hypothetical protein